MYTSLVLLAKLSGPHFVKYMHLQASSIVSCCFSSPSSVQHIFHQVFPITRISTSSSQSFSFTSIWSANDNTVCVSSYLHCHPQHSHWLQVVFPSTPTQISQHQEFKFLRKHCKLHQICMKTPDFFLRGAKLLKSCLINFLAISGNSMHFSGFVLSRYGLNYYYIIVILGNVAWLDMT